MEKTSIRPWDVVEHLKTDEDMAAYLEAALEEGDPTLIAAAIGDIARAKGVYQIEGMGDKSLHDALSPDAKPEFSMVFKVIQALGLRLHADTAPTESASPSTNRKASPAFSQ